jgi:pimeloyl-ACP methyl ester carboxylesterase
MEGIARSADGVPIHYEVLGSGAPALVFVHGWSCDRSYWRHQTNHFAAGHQVVAVDLAGHGESGVGRASWTMPAFGEDVAAVVEELGLHDMVLIGHSMGGDVIVEAALRLPGRVAGLVWVDTYTTLDEPMTAQEIQAFLVPFREDFVTTTRAFVRQMFVPPSDPGVVDRVVADMSAAPPDIAIDAIAHSIGNVGAVVAGLRRLTIPVVAMNPDRRPTDIEGLARHGVATVLMPGAGHFPMLEDPPAFNQVLSETIEHFGTSRSRGDRA